METEFLLQTLLGSGTHHLGRRGRQLQLQVLAAAATRGRATPHGRGSKRGPRRAPAACLARSDPEPPKNHIYNICMVRPRRGLVAVLLLLPALSLLSLALRGVVNKSAEAEQKHAHVKFESPAQQCQRQKRADRWSSLVELQRMRPAAGAPPAASAVGDMEAPAQLDERLERLMAERKDGTAAGIAAAAYQASLEVQARSVPRAPCVYSPLPPVTSRSYPEPAAETSLSS